MTLIVRVLLSGVVIAAAENAVAQEDWYPSRFGADDTLGAANLMSPEKVRDAVKLVKTGKTYSLGVEISRDTPAYGSRSFQLFAVASGTGAGETLGSNKATGNDDWILTWLGIGTQLDGLGHLGIDHQYYNGNHVEDFWQADGLTKLSTADVPPIVTRGVLLDIAGLRGEDMLAAGTAINRAEIDQAAKKQDVELREGDVVILNTGWQALAETDPQKFLSGQPGLGKEGAEYLAKLGVVAVGADTWGVEVVPFEDATEAFPVHQILLTKNGVYLLENIKTNELVADQAWEFLFVLGQPKMKGAVQMMINPVAIR
jgi:kynurenine formamidase